MRTTVKGKNFEVPDRVRRYAERKVGRLGRLLDDRSEVTLELSVEQHRSAEDSCLVDASLMIDGQLVKGHAAGLNHEAAVDVVLDKLERQAVDLKSKPRLRSRPAEEKEILRRIADGTADESRERRIVKVKRFAIEPMFEEDALSRMEELGHAFFVFVNAETERVGVLYRRRDGHFGLIEPVVGGEYLPGPDAGRRRSA